MSNAMQGFHAEWFHPTQGTISVTHPEPINKKAAWDLAADELFNHRCNEPPFPKKQIRQEMEVFDLGT